MACYSTLRLPSVFRVFCLSKLVSDGDPAIVEVVTAAENLEVVAVGHEGLRYLVYFFWLLRLPTTLTEDDVGHDIELSGVFLRHIYY